MEDEHCAMAGCDLEFETHSVRTTPRREFEIALGRRACPVAETMDSNGNVIRFVRSIENLRDTRIARKARLTDEEIYAVVGCNALCSPILQILRLLASTQTSS